MTVTINPDILAKLEEKAKSENRELDVVANELLAQALEEKKPYKLEWNTWEAEVLVDVSDRKKLYEDLYDDEYMRKRGFIE